MVLEKTGRTKIKQALFGVSELQFGEQIEVVTQTDTHTLPSPPTKKSKAFNDERERVYDV